MKHICLLLALACNAQVASEPEPNEPAETADAGFIPELVFFSDPRVSEYTIVDAGTE